jgi:hypothetical protein
MPAICLRRTDIPNGTLQVLDLWPNTSLRNQVYDPAGQTKYLRQPENSTVAVASNVTSAEYSGVAAWLIDTIEDTGDGGALSAAQANTIALALLAAMRSGAALTVAAVNVIVQLTVAASGIGEGASVGTLAELLEILAGGQYVVPAGTGANTGAGQYKGSAAGAFTAGTYRATYDYGALHSSAAQGALAALKSATFEYDGSTSAAVVVYTDTGTVL